MAHPPFSIGAARWRSCAWPTSTCPASGS
jgi:hypothetical protein